METFYAIKMECDINFGHVIRLLAHSKTSAFNALE